jgi:hypothetical protein
MNLTLAIFKFGLPKQCSAALSGLLVVFFLLTQLLPTLAYAKDKVALVEVEASAWGETKRDATLAALGEAIAQVNGRNVAAATSIKRATVEVGKDDEESYEWRNELQSEVSDTLRGVVDSYSILSETPDGSGWEVKVLANVARLVEGISKRKPLAIIPFTVGRGSVSVFGRSWDANDAARLLTQTLVDKVTGTRRFAVIDREFVAVTQQEASLKVDNPLTPMTTLMELANRLVAEYMIVGQLESLSVQKSSKYIDTIKLELVQTTATVTIAFRVIDVGSDQVKYAGTEVFTFRDAEIPSSGEPVAVGTRVLDLAADRIVEAMIDAIYPLLIVSVDGDVATINQGGDTVKVASTYEVYRYGEKIIDPYSRESLGRSETLVGILTVERVNPKTSLGRLSATKEDLGANLKPKSLVLRMKSRAEAPEVAKQHQATVNAKQSIEDKKKATDDDW